VPGFLWGQGVFDVKAYPFNAKSGTADMRVQIQKALDSAGVHHGTVIIDGQFVVTCAPTHPGTIDSRACLYIPSNVSLGFTSGSYIKRAANQPDTSYIIVNKNIGDSNIVVWGDGVLDGNGINNPVGSKAQYGISMFYVDNVFIEGLTVNDIRGSGVEGGLGNESMSINVSNCSNVKIMGCTVNGKSYTSSGFSANSSTNVSIISNTSRDCGIGNGFTQWNCRNVSYIGNFSFHNKGAGFNNEASGNTTYISCYAGGMASSATSGKFKADSLLGNTHGFIVLANDAASSIEYVGCHSDYNNGAGLFVNLGNNIIVDGGSYSYNGTQGIAFLPNCNGLKITGEPMLMSDTVAEIYYSNSYRTWQSIKDSVYIWTRSGNNISYSTGNVSIGTTINTYLLNMGNGSGLKAYKLFGGNGSAVGALGMFTDGTSELGIGTTNAIVGGDIGVSESGIQGSGGNLRIWTSSGYDLMLASGGWNYARLTIHYNGDFDFHSNKVTGIDSLALNKLSLSTPLPLTSGGFGVSTLGNGLVTHSEAGFSTTPDHSASWDAKVSFPGFGTSHGTAAYGDHTHSSFDGYINYKDQSGTNYYLTVSKGVITANTAGTPP
jgi:hypothetical protein